MNGFSAGAAIGAGFRLIGREPLAFLAWALALLLVGVLPTFWAFSQIFGMVGEIARVMPEGATDRPPPEFLRLQARMMQVQPVLLVSSILSFTLVTSAILRAALGFDEKTFFYFRIGSREMWLTLVSLAIYAFYLVGVFALLIPVGVVAAIAAVAKAKALFWLLPVAVIASFGVGLWALLRVSLAPVMSFSENTFLLFESWPLTRGHALKIFGVGLALSLIVLVAEMVLFIGGLVAANAATPLEQLFGATRPGEFPDFASLGYGYWAPAALLLALFWAFANVLYVAAWAEIYRALRPPPPAAA